MNRNRFVDAWRCPGGHLWMYRHGECPECGKRLIGVAIGSGAKIVSHTVVRVNPTGSPIRLGVAVTSAGAATLCVIDGRIRGNGRDRVTLVTRNGRFHAVTRFNRPGGGY